MERDIAWSAETIDASPASRASVAEQVRQRAIIEIAAAFCLIFAVMWTPRPWQVFLWWAAALTIVALSAASYEGLAAMGVRTTNFLSSLWVVAVALAISAAAGVIGWWLHTVSLPGSPLLLVQRYWAYAAFALVQQFLIQCFFLSRLLRLLPTPRQAAVAAACLFALAHVPNPFLIAVTVVWGLVAALIFLRYRNLWTVAIAHAILGITIGVTVPGHFHHNMRVGLGYLKYRPGAPPAPHRNHNDQIASTVAWVTADAPTRLLRIHARP